MLKTTLRNIGLSDREAEVYLMLVQHQSIRPSVLAERLALPRTTVQNILLRLERQGLAMQIKEEKVQRYAAVHPENLLSLLQIQRKQALSEYERNEEELRRVLPEIVGNGNNPLGLRNAADVCFMGIMPERSSFTMIW